MRYGHFEALAPLCPRCLHQRGVAAPLKVAAREEERAGNLWHGWLLCTNPACQLEFPVIDGVPLIVADPAAMLATLGWQALRRDDLPAGLESMLGDALGPGCEFDTTRQHLSLYGQSHYGDWACGAAQSSGGPVDRSGTVRASAAPTQRPDSQGAGRDAVTQRGRAARTDRVGAPCDDRDGAARATRPPGGVAVVDALEAEPGALPGLPDGPVLDLGSGPGRTGWELAFRTGRMVLGADLSLTFLRLAQRLRLEGRVEVPRRRLGLVYDRLRLEVPASHAGAGIDFWALDAQALPFAPGSAALLTLVNLLDCVPAPTALLAEAARVARPAALALLTTPFDWSAAATRPENWLGGHAQRSPQHGAAEPALAVAARQAGWQLAAAREGPDWWLPLHDRSEMTYHLHLTLLRRG